MNKPVLNLAESQRVILDQLKRHGPQSVKVLAKRLNMTTMGVRQHLQELHGNDLVKTTTEARQTRGRPLHLWRLTTTGHEFFPARHKELNRELLTAINQELGESTLNRLINSQADMTARRYDAALAGITELEQRIAKLAEIRSDEGFMAEVRLLPDESWLLIENHCPIFSAAKVCRKYCESELELFQRVLGDQVTVYRTEYLLQGSRRCAYRISASGR